MIKFTCIVSGDDVFINKPTPFNVTPFFDGEVGEKTYNDQYVKISKYPEKITFLRKDSGNVHYILTEEALKDKYPKKLEYNDLYGEDAEYEGLSGLYERVVEEPKEYYVELEYEIDRFDVEEFDFIKRNYTGHVSFVNELRLPKVLHSTVPNYLEADQFYKIIRDYIKNNIDPKVARITSDYDFCFTVKKVVKLNAPVPYKVDVSSIRAKKPKYELRYKDTELVECFEMAPKAYQNYSVVGPIYGKNAKELEEKVNAYLEDLIRKINEPVVECKHCGGLGVIFEKINVNIRT